MQKTILNEIAKKYKEAKISEFAKENREFLEQGRIYRVNNIYLTFEEEVAEIFEDWCSKQTKTPIKKVLNTDLNTLIAQQKSLEEEVKLLKEQVLEILNSLNSLKKQ